MKAVLAWLVPLALLPLALADAGDNCSLTNRPARRARYLKFCQDYNDKSCCIPGHDLENQVQFENLIEGLGPGCKNPMMYPEVRFFYCLGCDPKQPDYTTGETIRVCKSFLEKLWRDPAYEECGVMYSNPCPGPEWDFDPYMCGDTLLLPKDTYNDNVTLFINAFKPPGLEDYTFVMVDDSLPLADRLPCWEPDAESQSGAASRLGGTSYWLATALVVSVTAALQLLQSS